MCLFLISIVLQTFFFCIYVHDKSLHLLCKLLKSNLLISIFNPKFLYPNSSSFLTTYIGINLHVMVALFFFSLCVFNPIVLHVPFSYFNLHSLMLSFHIHDLSLNDTYSALLILYLKNEKSFSIENLKSNAHFNTKFFFLTYVSSSQHT